MRGRVGVLIERLVMLTWLCFSDVAARLRGIDGDEGSVGAQEHVAGRPVPPLKVHLPLRGNALERYVFQQAGQGEMSSFARLKRLQFLG